MRRFAKEELIVGILASLVVNCRDMGMQAMEAVF